MVLYSCRKKFFKEAFETVNQLRLNRQLCDIELTVGANSIHAHRIVLLAGSDYFRTLFLGPFSESSMPKVDLSSTTDDFQTFNSIVDFLYKGQIEINDDNLEDLMKMSSCFLIPQLQQFCTEFIQDNLILSKAVTFYFYALKYGFVELEKEVGAIVKSRFHDYFVFESGTLNLSPDQIRHLFQNNFMDFCTWNSMLNFLDTWLDTPHISAEHHLTVADSILQKIDTEYVSCGNTIDMHEAKNQCSETIGALERIASRLKSYKGVKGKRIFKHCQQLLQSLSNQKTVDLLNQGLRKVIPRLCLDTQPQKQKSSGAENVLIIIANRQCVIDEVDELVKSDFDFQTEKDLDTFTGPVFDVCSYSPRTKEWRFLHSLGDVGIGNSLLNSSCYAPWEFTCIDDRLYGVAFAETFLAPAYILKLEDFSTLHVSRKDQDWIPEEFKSEFTCLIGATDHTVYSVSLDDDDDCEPFIRCRGFTVFENFNPNHNDDVTGTIVSIPKSERHNRSSSLGDSSVHCACFSQTTNELLVVVTSGRIDTLFVIDVKTKSYRKYETEDYTGITDHFWFAVLQAEDRCYLLEIMKEKASPHMFKVQCKYQYMYGSKCLSITEQPDVYLKHCDSYVNYDSATPPVFYETVLHDKEHVWIFVGNKRGTSSLTEIYINQEGNLSAREHTPPPFLSMAAWFTATVSNDYLLGKETVTKYLL